MRILHLTYHIKYGGMERQLMYLLNTLAQRGHEIHVAYFNEGLDGAKHEFHNVHFHKIKKHSNYNPFIIWHLVRLIHNINPDIIHSWHYLMDIFGGIVTRLTKHPWVLREPLPRLDSDTTIKTRIRDCLGCKADMIISNSLTGDLYWKKRCAKTLRSVIFNGLPLDDIKKITRAKLANFSIKTNKNIILYVGQLLTRKNVEIILSALPSVLEKCDAIAVFVGEGPQKQYLQNKANSLGIEEAVYFTGQITKEQVWSLMKKADVFVFMSSNEGCPNAVLEAMACNCPLIVSDIPPHREILNHASAMFVQKGDTYSLSSTIVQTLKNPETAARRADLAKKIAETYSIDSMVNKYEQIYQALIVS